MTKFAPFPERFSVAGRTIVVTGGGRGLGLTFVECLAAAGANVAVIDVHEQPEAPVQDLIKSGANVKYHKCDITNRPHLKEVIDQTAKDFGAINGLITAAAIMTNKPFLDHTPDDMARSYAINVIGTLSPVQICAEHMIAQGTGGSIICIASTAGHMGQAPQTATAYVCDKHAVVGLVRQAAGELTKFNVRVNSISPGPYNTPMMKQLLKETPDQEARFIRATTMKRMGEPPELHGALLFLLSDASSYVTANDFRLDGGGQTSEV